MSSYVRSGGRDAGAAERACDALQNLVVREPEYGTDARLFAWQFVAGMWSSHRTDLVAGAVRAGLDADLMTESSGRHPGPAALLLTHLAASQQRDGARLDGLSTLRSADARLAGRDPDDVIASAALGHSALVRAELQELGLERTEARTAFAEARRWLGSLTAETHRDRLLELWLPEMYGVGDVSQQQREGLRHATEVQLGQWHVDALLGAFRTIDGDAAGLAELTEAIRAAIADRRLAKAVHPLLLVDPVSRLAPGDARAFADALLRASSADPAALLREAGDLPPELIERYSAVPTDHGEARALEIAMAAAMASAMERTGDHELANGALHEAVTSQMSRPGSPAVPLAFLFGSYAGLLARRSSDEQRVSAMIDMFLTVFDAARRSDPDAFEDLRLRALFDPFVAETASWLLGRAPDMEDEPTRYRIAGLLDLLRVPRIPPRTMLGGKDVLGDGASALAAGLRVVQDTLGRVAAALAGADGVVAVIPHEHDSGEQDIVLVDSATVSVHRVDRTFAGAVEQLDRAAELALFKSSAGLLGGTADALTRPARAAFDALPGAVQETLHAANTVLVAPDHRHVLSDVPWELLHDGTAHLMGSRVVARFTSLRHLARTLDTPVLPPQRPPRALAVAAAEGLPERPLPTADPEVSTVRDVLAGRGFDAPQISPGRLSADYLTERLGRVDVLHVAAHGTSEAGTEYLVLPNGERLSVDDLLRRPAPRPPFVYLNTCELGRTRYLGGGQARGLAFTLAEMGAPAVVANTTDVLDTASTSIAVRFYEESQDAPAGQALLAARRRLLADGVDPAVLARVVLIGDPWHVLDPRQRQDETVDAAGELIRTYFDIEPGATDAAAEQRLAEALAGPSSHHRLLAARALVSAAAGIAPGSSDQQTRADVDIALALADELGAPEAQAVLRLLRAQVGLPEPARWTEEQLLRDAVTHLETFGPEQPAWGRMAFGIRARLRRAEMAARGLTITQRLPDGTEPDPAMDAVVDVVLVSEQRAEEQRGRVTPRVVETGLHDISYNAVVLGHPNRFEDTISATAYCRLLTRKLIAGGHVPATSEERTLPMVCGLLWHLWSTQKTSFLDRDVVEGQAGAVDALVRDIAAGHPVDDVLEFPAEVDRVLAVLDAVPWERVHIEVPTQMADLADRAEALLDTIPPEELPAAAAFVTGVLATRNTYTSLEGQDAMEEHMTAALWRLSHANDARFAPYLNEGFAPLREREPDELLRWMAEDELPATRQAGTRAVGVEVH
ncbi:CHAT domain-containing protein [Geodermatophilus sp. SYSU D00696]